MTLFYVKLWKSIDEAETLDQLSEVLNTLGAEMFHANTSFENLIGILELPVWGTGPNHVEGVLSWDETRVMVLGGPTMRVVISDRCKCGEASFHCHCNPIWAKSLRFGL